MSETGPPPRCGFYIDHITGIVITGILTGNHRTGHLG
jgi:hypothetical protein